MLKRKKGRKGNSKNKLAKEKNRNYRIIALFIIAILFSIVGTEIAYFLYNIRYVKVLTAKLEVGSSVGFALGEEKFDIINFGTAPPGGGGKRFLTVENQDKIDIFTHIIVLGGIKKFLGYENNFILHVNEIKKLEFAVFVPENAKNGRYNGKIFLIFQRA